MKLPMRFFNIFGGGGGSVKTPKLSQVDIPQAADLFSTYQNEGYAASDADWQKRFPELFGARNFMFGDAASQLSGGLPAETIGALKTAGLGAEAAVIPGKNPFVTARNLGEPVLALEQRGRNFAENLLSQNPERQVSLSGADVTKIAEANTGNVNAFNQALFGNQLNQFDANQAQNAQNLQALTSIVSGGIKSQFWNQPDPYTGGGFYVPNAGAPIDFAQGFSDLPLTDVAAGGG